MALLRMQQTSSAANRSIFFTAAHALQKLPMTSFFVCRLLNCDRLFVKKRPIGCSSCGHSSDINGAPIDRR